ncbi:MAG: hypothetical protein O2967_14180 [Proteobacteria bacterium]|nr:hypothetical protein [Pseudomonadota bacterium]
MSDKPIAMLVAALVVAPICSVCILGPAVIAGFFAGWFGWVGDLSALQMIALGVAAAALVLGISRYRHSRKTDAISAASESHL